MSQYNTVAGFVQFDVAERQAKDQDVRDVVVQAIGSGGDNVKITVWPEYAHIAIERGDLVFANGKFTSETVNGKTYHNLSASKLKVFSSDEKSEVTNKLDEDEGDLLF